MAPVVQCGNKSSAPTHCAVRKQQIYMEAGEVCYCLVTAVTAHTDARAVVAVMFVLQLLPT